MHRGVRQLMNWVRENAEELELELNPPASSEDISALEQVLGGPLPMDLRLVLTRFNGATLPVGTLLPAGLEPKTIGATIREYAESVGRDFLDPDLLLPFCRTREGSLLCFDRSAGPVADTWPIVDYYEDLDEHHLMYRTFNGWCRVCVAEWSSDDFWDDFTLETYLRSGQRHAEFEPDVSTAHATVAHALRRAGRPEEALKAYMRAATCVPSLPRTDWEGLKLAVLLRDVDAAFECASRLSSRAPHARWQQRETTALKVAEMIRILLVQADAEVQPWLRLLDALIEQSTHGAQARIQDIREAAANGGVMPEMAPRVSAVPPAGDKEAWLKSCREAYVAGALREEDILLDPQMTETFDFEELADILRQRRDFG